MIWFVGDSAISSAVQEFGAGEDLLDSSQPRAAPEDVWTEQMLDSRRRWPGPVKVIVYLSQQEYDSEATVWQILSRVPVGSTVTYLYPLNSPLVKEGLGHYEDLPVYGVEVESVAHDYILDKLRAS